eukprot:553588_1
MDLLPIILIISSVIALMIVSPFVRRHNKKQKEKLSHFAVIIDEIIKQCNEIREQLVSEKDKTKIYKQSNHLTNILNTMHQLNNQNIEKQYIDMINIGLKGDRLLISGYLHGIAEQITMNNVENICVRFYSLNAHILQDNTDEEKYPKNLCEKMKEILPISVADVIIDDVNNREQDRPLRIIDHRLKHSLLRTRSKITVAINPTNAIIQVIMDRFKKDENDTTITDLIQLLFETQLTTLDLALIDPASISNKVNKLLSIGLGIVDSDADSD